MSQEELQSLCVEWQKVLRLQDWDVKVKVVRYHEIPDRQGRCNFQVSKKIAVVRVLDAGDAIQGGDWQQDQETTLVHELIHLHYAPVDETTGLAETILEQAVNAMALALVGLKRDAQLLNR